MSKIMVTLCFVTNLHVCCFLQSLNGPFFTFELPHLGRHKQMQNHLHQLLLHCMCMQNKPCEFEIQTPVFFFFVFFWGGGELFS